MIWRRLVAVLARVERNQRNAQQQEYRYDGHQSGDCGPTGRQRSMLQLLAERRSNKQIATQLASA
jgi:hypothetical protein